MQTTTKRPAMELVRASDSVICIVSAFAMALGLLPETILLALGHDGNKIVNDLPSPKNKRGIHIQELIPIALDYGFSVTPFELIPVLESAPITESTRAGVAAKIRRSSTVINSEARFERFFEITQTRRGVITGLNVRGNGHAVAFDHGMIYDPSLEEPVPASLVLQPTNGFYARAAWIVDRIADEENADPGSGDPVDS